MVYVRKRWVNFDFMMVIQFSNVITFQLLLILGFFITRLVVNLTDFDTTNNDLHITCPQAPLNLGSLDAMGLLLLLDGIPCFIPLGPPVSRDQCISSKKKKPRDHRVNPPPQPELQKFMDFTLL